MPTYTTTADVLMMVKNQDGDLDATEVDKLIDDGEGIIHAVMRRDFLQTFDSVRHGILTAATRNYAAYWVVLYNPGAFTSISEALNIADRAWDTFVDLLDELRRPEVAAYLEGD